MRIESFEKFVAEVRCGMGMRLKKCLALSVPLVLLGFVMYKTGCYFETNDDRYITSILSGVITGSPDAHAIYVNYLLTFPLSLLYRITIKVPWYGGMLFLFQWLIYASVLESAYSSCRKWVHLILVTAMVGGFFIAYYYIVGLIEFTSTAAMLASAGYACILLHDNRRTGYVLFAALNLFGFLLRSKAMLMVQPLGLAAVLVIMIGEKGEWKILAKKMLFVTTGVLFALCLGLVGCVIGYHGEGWRRCEQFIDLQTVLFDYHESPDYEEIRNILNDYQISKNKYEAFCDYIVLDWKVDAECDRRLISYVENTRAKDFRIKDLLEQVYEISIARSQWDMNRITIAAWFLFLLWMILRRNWKQLFTGVIFLGGARMAVWTYLAWGGRIPARVTIPLLACEVLLLLALVWIDCQKTESALWKKSVLILGGFLFCMVSILSGRQQSRYIGENNRGQKIYMEGLREIQEYCGSRPQERFLIDSRSLSFYAGSALETSVYHPVNYVIGGGWFSNAPVVQQRLESYLGNAEGFYFLIYADGNQEESPAFTYLVEEMGEEPELTDLWTASHGGSYAVYYFEGGFPFS